MNDSAAPVLEATGITRSYQDGTRHLEVLRGIDLSVNGGECVSIVGRSGGGKSTLLHILGALDRPTSGTVRIGGEDLAKLAEGDLAKLRARRVGFIYQFHHLLPEFSALENVMLPGMILGWKHGELVQRSEMLLKEFGLGDRLTHRPAKLSGGERQRVALARALLNDPQVILADEPTGDLDQDTGREVFEFILDQIKRTKKAMVLVTHDVALAKVGHRRFRLADGVLKGAE